MTIDTENTTNQPTKPRGRPLAFTHEAALDAALQVFWTHGYEGTSMANLTTALGMNKPSIYAAFGNKEALFLKVLDRYRAGPVAFVALSLDEPSAEKVAEKFLMGAVNFFADPNTPNGCLIVQGALTCGPDASAVQKLLIEYRKNLENALMNRFELAKLQGDLQVNVNTEHLAKYLITLHQGLSVQASSGASKASMLAVAEIGLANWATLD